MSEAKQLAEKLLILAKQRPFEFGSETMIRAAETLERFRIALEKIASCESHHEGDVVSIARIALREDGVVE